ncbi:nucleotide exchange factor GrpE [Patescibacteria group bacterium]|nr:nucleotide exchange factor GrpE [Patescibacteria group bacterium]MBU0776760.1 nucleotide exchange factor GrpE [Patescibacteria group bacterium]MBU0846333.1 nucleotide exchange factor GrpE [Patescibacteria group bacterium]MBU0922707.1 nucleotide exchange factor GrpE [Patescibacteria group bacterium]MBU1066758.1 nucleotide exchange factor GrpE [Patescibacteria group bacterium]
MKKQKITKINEKELGKVKNQLMRALADYDNLRKRIEREREGFEKIVSARFATKILSVFDMIEEAQRHLKDSGIALTLEEFKKILSEEGIEKIMVGQGDKFDEKVCEAVEVVENGKDGKIAEVILTGWKFKEGPVIRPTKVKVSKGK